MKTKACADRWAVMVPTINRRNELLRFLYSVIRQDILPAQVIIVDASRESQQDIVEKFPELRSTYIHLPACSVAVARNTGFQRLLPEIELVSVFDDDIVLLEGAARAMLSYWKTAPGEVGVALFNVMNFKTPTAWAVLKRPFCAWNKKRGVVLRSGINTMLFPVSVDTYVQWFPSGIMTLKRKVIEEFSFDEWYTTVFCEDLDFGYRVGKKYKIRIITAAQVEHLHSSSSRPDRVRFGRTQVIDRYHFIGKDPEYFSRFLFYWANLGCILEHLLKGIAGFNKEYLKTAYGNILGVFVVLFHRGGLRNAA